MLVRVANTFPTSHGCLTLRLKFFFFFGSPKKKKKKKERTMFGCVQVVTW